jgi:phosphomannomutase
MDEEQALPIVLEAQEVFALVCLAELAWMEYIGLLQTKDSGSAGSRPPDGSPGPAGTYSAGTRRDQACSQTAGPARTAVVVNGPTSLRIERICAAFGVETRRAEVGEANVVGKAAELRSNGVRVRILGEGSNGGTICHPATVRDPLATVFSFIKLLYVRSQPGRPGLFELWCRKSGQAAAFKADYSLRDILRSLPCFKTTETGDPRAKMQIKNPDYHNLKLKYESLFMRQWNERTQLLKEEYGIYSWKEVNYEGSREKRGFGPSCRSGLEKGGLKILFSDRAGRDKAFIWMRPSGTEPVFRIAADAECRPAGGSAAALHGGAEGRSSLHDYLLHWQRDMIEEADLMIGS